MIDFECVITNGYCDISTIEAMSKHGWEFVVTVPAKTVHPHAMPTDKATIFVRQHLCAQRTNETASSVAGPSVQMIEVKAL